jgi:hypothetical protein
MFRTLTVLQRRGAHYLTDHHHENLKTYVLNVIIAYEVSSGYCCFESTYVFRVVLQNAFLPIHFILISLVTFSIIVIVYVPLSCSFRQNAPIYWCYKLPMGFASAPYENLFLTTRPTYRSRKGVPIATSPSGKVLVAALLVLSVCG